MNTRWSIRLVTVAVAWAASYPALATDRHVPGEYGTIQAAIDACVAGDVVIVADGTYTGTGNKNLDFGGKAITVRSASGDPAACIIDCENSGRGFFFHSGETATSIVQGLTIRHANADGVSCDSSRPALTNCTITGGTTTDGVGVRCGYNTSPTMTNCTISGNAGGGVYCSFWAGTTLTNCAISENTGDGVYCGGGSTAHLTNCAISANTGIGVNCGGDSAAQLTNCTISGNTGGGVYCTSHYLELTNCILWGDTPPEIFVQDGFLSSVTYCNVQGGWSGEGNIDANPGFAFSQDVHLLPDSPCIDAGTNGPPGGLPPNDLDGQARLVDGDGDGAAVADMGVYEFNPAAPALAVSATSFEFQVPPGQTRSQTLQIRNSGVGTLAWALQCEATWLMPDPAAGESAGEVDAVTLTADTVGLAQGIYLTTLWVNAPEAVNAPRRVTVVLHVGTILYVDDDAPNDPGPSDPTVSDPNEDGTLEHPFDAIQEAIDEAQPADEVVLADGVYTGAGNKDLDFRGRAITVRSASGDPAMCIIDCEGGGRGFYFHSSETATSIVQGLTIRNGNVTTESPGSAYGGGVYCYSSSPTLTNCTIAGNNANGYGGGVHCSASGLTLINCTITGNRASDGGGLYCSGGSLTLTNCTIAGNTASRYGGGTYCGGSYPRLTNCTITGNRASDGGGVYCNSSSPTLTNCAITGNTARSDGGGVYCNSSSPTLINCTIAGNNASRYGGGTYCGGSYPRLTNCTITGNRASDGGGVYCNSSSPTLTNCILWTDTPQEIFVASGSPVVTYCNAQGGWSGTGNINVEPRFAFPDDFHLLPASPCIDAGTNSPPGGLPADDADGQPRPLDGDGNGSALAEMGAYEFNPATPTLALSATEFELFVLQGQVASRTLDIRNSSLGTLAWASTSEAGWLTANPIAGESAGEVDAVTLTADTVGLAQGIYLTTLWVNAPEAVNAPRSVIVILHVTLALHVPSEYATIQAAIDATTRPGDEVVVADGVYVGAGNKDLDFHGKAITVRSASGDPATCIIDCESSGRGFYFHSGETTTSIVQGLSVQNGNVTGSGGGVSCESSSPMLINCAIAGNTATSQGGGVYCDNYSSPTLTDCMITDNNANDGGGVSCSNSGAMLTNCTVAGNVATSQGGGVCCPSSGTVLMILKDCRITGNRTRWGGGIYGRACLVNCMIAGNGAEISGAGIYATGNTTLRMSNCVLTANAAGWYGGGVCAVSGSAQLCNCTLLGNVAGWYGGGVYGYDSNHAVVTNSILTRNAAVYGSEIALEDSSFATVSYSDIHGNQPIFVSGLSYVDWGGGSINADPRFIDPNQGDFRLQLNSPCVDAGSNALVAPDLTDLDRDGDAQELVPFDLAGSMRVARFTVDMGAYEVPFGDLNCDRAVNYGDINPFVVALNGQATYEARYPNCIWLYADLNGDGVVDYGDINPFVRLLSGGN